MVEINPQTIAAALQKVVDQASFIQTLLADTLNWPIGAGITAIGDITYDWPEKDLRARDLDKTLIGGRVLQVQLATKQPWGIFILEFQSPDVFSEERGMTGILRQVLRGLVQNRNKATGLPSWKHEHLLFICTHNYQQFRLGYFKAPKDGAKIARLAAFGWRSESPEVRTVCEFNLTHLGWPIDAETDAQAWLDQWADAFDVEKVTKRFYTEYHEEFEKLRKSIDGVYGEDQKMFTQTLMNRLMFLRFIERKNWLHFPADSAGGDYLRRLFAAGRYRGMSFYAGRLKKLFFEGLAIEGKQQSESIGKVPFLNGGLFEQSTLDEQVSDIPDRAFEPLLGDDGLFYRFNFTVQESTPLDIEVALDPEMLGKVFEELVTGRHGSGSYYTPRPVVSFMCCEALKGYLADKTKALADAITALVDKHEIKGLNESHAKQILDALESVKAVDPACGSGAYLLGLLQELIAVRRTLQSEKLAQDPKFLYNLKLGIISHNLYGVDIDPFATNIAMLRLWLSLAVEADDPLPLPNLDFKIETGDSLVGPDPSAMPDLFREQLQRRADLLVMLKDKFLNAHDVTKHQQMTVIRKEEREIAQSLQSVIGRGVIDWRIHFAEVFGKTGGFDIVLANPPYVRHILLAPKMKSVLLALFPKAAKGKSDLFVYFYARGIELLRPGGMHIFICSNSWLDAAYGGALQKYLLEQSHVLAIYDSAIERQFATADINTIISVLQKGTAADEAQTRFVSLRAQFVEAIENPAKRREISITRRELWKDGVDDANQRGVRVLL